MSLDQETWTEIARLWLDGVEPLGRIAERFAITHQAITARARREHWPARGGGAKEKPSGGRTARPAGGRRTTRVDAGAPGARGVPGASGGAAKAKGAAGSDRNAASPSGSAWSRDRRGKRHHAGAHRVMVERLFDAMDTKLSAIEERIASGGDTTSADSERTTRALNTLVRSLEKLADYEGKISKSTGGNDGKRRQASDDPERRRQELARRIERLLKRG